jgi:hypothetical protein
MSWSVLGFDLPVQAAKRGLAESRSLTAGPLGAPGHGLRVLVAHLGFIALTCLDRPRTLRHWPPWLVALLLAWPRAAPLDAQLRITPAEPAPGAELELAYEGALASDATDTLKLRARLRHAGGELYNHGPLQRTVALLVRGDDGVFRGSFRLPEGVVYGSLAVEDRTGSRVDHNAGRMWETKQNTFGRIPRASSRLMAIGIAGFAVAACESPIDLDLEAYSLIEVNGDPLPAPYPDPYLYPIEIQPHDRPLRVSTGTLTLTQAGRLSMELVMQCASPPPAGTECDIEGDVIRTYHGAYFPSDGSVIIGGRTYRAEFGTDRVEFTIQVPPSQWIWPVFTLTFRRQVA